MTKIIDNFFCKNTNKSDIYITVIFFSVEYCIKFGADRLNMLQKLLL